MPHKIPEISEDFPARILTIAGSDSGGGAGIQADIKTITMLGGHALTAITSLTAQNTQGVTRIDVIAPEMVIAQINAVMTDIGVSAIKIGMVGNGEVAIALADYLEKFPDIPVVLDPVMVATSGSTLADDKTIAAYDRLMFRADLITPNIPELEILTHQNIQSDQQLIEAGRQLAHQYDSPILAKGGHGEGAILVDRLILPDGQEYAWQDSRILTKNTHGTGCSLSSAIATSLGQGLSLKEAVTRARHYIRKALEKAPSLGKGHGPIGHTLGISAFDRWFLENN
ncbi:MAG: bifunctional hydroxymethylpyrimidine kinase/phosphomethylpyrimidine kinase [Zymomonas mobilis]|uniref:hydroxymethylpyrimidine kinase n=1 Tax=Zymomonas mobilis TaxID=542 RepID=A0A542W1H5_ZYMMB|nr:bifunctional hydroxymethylpyrimidine kinase/phosphomethylpyrimidine kinase [Zymomonas mobilis]TQL17403.1 hydroxymethylpyrimidine/phosphomethylpyrimidine kinase [Zymomonas mobilis]